MKNGVMILTSAKVLDFLHRDHVEISTGKWVCCDSLSCCLPNTDVVLQSRGMIFPSHRLLVGYDYPGKGPGFSAYIAVFTEISI